MPVPRLFSSLAVCLALAGAAVAADPHPNLLLLVAEDLGPRIGAFGDGVADTPNLDRLAAEGVRYTRVFTTSGVCAPSRAALLTGIHQIALGAQHMRTSSRPAGAYRAVPPPEIKAFPELLRAAGYYTFTDYKLDYQFSGPLKGSGPFTIWDSEEFAPDWRERPPDRPFFGMVNFFETHESGILLPLGNFPHGLTHFSMQFARLFTVGFPDTASVPIESIEVPPYLPDTPTVRGDLVRHYTNIHAMDAEVGEILARLEADGLVDSTVVVWTADHGDGMPRAKRELFDSGLRVPMIIRWPVRYRPRGAEPGSVDDRLVSFVDLAPTFLELAGVTPPATMQGRSLVDASGVPRNYVYASRDRIDEQPDRQRAVRDARFKYIRSWHPDLAGGHPLSFRDDLESMRELRALHAAGRLDPLQSRWFEPVGEERLYDTGDDPHELRDLSADPGHAEVLARMRGALDAWLARVGDSSQTPEDEMVAAFWPGGVAPVTAMPQATLEDGIVRVTCATPGASIGFRRGGGNWKLYTGSFAAPSGTTLAFKAVRYGWDESGEVRLSVP
ncbi:MAG: sulfatase [Myxococcota bacterium]|nr:sulfatase [Myxococcota bacterium]MDP7301143.1 sulfatase [Myxococcota bacterium]MDP7434544.1 sulfatase [Myxococcota bacterium]